MPGYHRRHTVNGTLHLGIAQVVAGVGLLGFGLSQCGFGFEQGVAHRLNRYVTHHVALLQARLILIVHAGCGQTGLRTLTGSYGYLEGSTIGHLVDDEQRLSATDGLTFGCQDTGDAAGDLRTDFYNLTARESGAVLSGERHVLLAHHHRLVLCCVGCLLFLIAAGNGQQTGEGQTEIRIVNLHVDMGILMVIMHRQRPCRLQG